MHTRKIHALAPVLLAGTLGPAGIACASDWSVDVGTEPSRVTLGSRAETWWTNRVQLTATTAPGAGMFVGVEEQRREHTADMAFFGGAYGRSGRWRWSGQLSVSNQPTFLPRYSIEPALGYQVGQFEVQAGASYKSFFGQTTRSGSLGLTRYRGDDEYAVKFTYGTTQPGDRHIRVATIRALFDRGGPYAMGFSLSAGQGLYDAANIPGTKGNHGWLANANLRYRMTRRDSLRLDVGVGRENPSFRERKLGLSYRRTF